MTFLSARIMDKSPQPSSALRGLTPTDHGVEASVSQDVLHTCHCQGSNNKDGQCVFLMCMCLFQVVFGA